jgi:CDP-6-deoxy-D-xylo-4-hexulose-3-dehydrase
MRIKEFSTIMASCQGGFWMEKELLRDNVFQAALKYHEVAHAKKNFVPGETYIPPSGKVVDGEDLLHLIDASLDLWLTAGRFSRELEVDLSKVVGVKPKSLLVNSGSSANLLAVSALTSPMMEQFGYPRLQRGDEVITVAAGFPTTVNPIVQNGAIPVFVDVDLHTLNAVPEAIMAAKTSKTKAVVLAHTLGNPYRADIVADWCKKENLLLVEDCCDALGATIHDRGPVGTLGHFGTLSFYPAHHITMGEGGATFSRDARLRRIAESVRDWGRDCWCDPGVDNTCKKRFDWQLGDLPEGYDHKYIYSNVGYNLKVTDMQAAIGMSQLRKLPKFIEARRANYRRLFDGVKASPILRDRLRPVEATTGTEPSWFGFPIVCEPGVNRNKIVRSLEERKVGTRLIFAGNLTKQPAYRGQNYRIHGELTNTDRVMSDAFWIGVWPGISNEMMTYMLEQLEAVVSAQ